MTDAILVSQFPIEVNLSGEWYPALVETVTDQNNVVADVLNDSGYFERHKVQRGTDSGEFRTRQG